MNIHLRLKIRSSPPPPPTHTFSGQAAQEGVQYLKEELCAVVACKYTVPPLELVTSGISKLRQLPQSTEERKWSWREIYIQVTHAKFLPKSQVFGLFF